VQRYFQIVVTLLNSISKDTEMEKDKRCEIDKRALDDALQSIGGKWKLQILSSIFNGNTRFSEIEHDLQGITKRTLSRELKELEANQFVKKIVFPEMPTKAEYKPTAYAMKLSSIIDELVNWGQNHRKKIIGHY